MNRYISALATSIPSDLTTSLLVEERLHYLGGSLMFDGETDSLIHRHSRASWEKAS